MHDFLTTIQPLHQTPVGWILHLCHNYAINILDLI